MGRAVRGALAPDIIAGIANAEKHGLWGNWCELHGEERVYTCWHYIRNRWERNSSPAEPAASLHEAGVDACQFVYRAAGGASLRKGVMQRVYREMLTAANHFTISPGIVAAAGRDIGGMWNDRVWRFYDLVERK